MIAFLGFGELGRVLGSALKPTFEVRSWSRSRGTLTAALEDAQAVISAVPGSAAESVFSQALPLLSEDTLFVDLTAAAPDVKESAAARHALYVDGAVLGTVAASGATVPIVVAGAGAERFRELVSPAGLNVSVVDGDAGTAARLKLVRSVYMKGRDALVLEMMLAARRLGVEDEVARSIAGPGEEVPFAELSERVLRALAVHAGRRASELDSAAALLRELGVDPLVTVAGSARLRWLAERGLRERFGGERPPDGRATLDAIDEADDAAGGEGDGDAAG
jgi:3-hydroxyisobutyrate dehydrogenase-like beta-hydroxyacid dehydrogenase